jgi:succinate dehydrogenase/fumarate reductase flavoprotein subunit
MVVPSSKSKTGFKHKLPHEKGAREIHVRSNEDVSGCEVFDREDEKKTFFHSKKSVISAFGAHVGESPSIRDDTGVLSR